MAKTKVLAGRKLALVPILRAGMGMLDGMLTLLPAAKVGFIGLYRDERPCSPWSTSASCRRISPSVTFWCWIPCWLPAAAPSTPSPRSKHGKAHQVHRSAGRTEGIKALHEAHPDVDIYLGAKDDCLNENGYIVPGLGDAGDRIYGTK